MKPNCFLGAWRTLIYGQRRLIAMLLLPMVLVGCGTRPAPAALNVNRVWVVPVAPIPQMYTENKGLPIGILWQSIADNIKSSEFTRQLDQARLSAATRMTGAVVAALNAQGFQAQVLEGVQRPADAPNNIDASKLPTKDPVLLVYFNEVGMYSSRFSLDYVPKINVYAQLMDSGKDDLGYFDYVYYGADARGSESWSVPADPKFRWSSFNDLVSQPQKVAEAYDAGVDAIATRLAVNLRAQVQARARITSAVPAR